MRLWTELSAGYNKAVKYIHACGTYFKTRLDGQYIWEDNKLCIYDELSFMFWMKATMKHLIKYKNMQGASFCLERAKCLARKGKLKCD